MGDEFEDGASTSTLEISQPDTQFIPQEDDAEILWEVIEITAEKNKLYRVRWAGNDPKTRKPWPMSWVPKHDCTDDLVLAWKRKQAKKRKGAEQKKSGKRGDTTSKRSRGSALSLTSAGTSRGGSAASSITAGTKSHAYSNATATPRAGPSKLKPFSHSPPKTASTSNDKSSATVNLNGKRTHPPSYSPLNDEDEDSLPEVAALTTLTKPRPRKKRKIEVDAVEPDPGISQEIHEIRPAGIAKRGTVLPVAEEEEESEDEVGLPGAVGKPDADRPQTRLTDKPLFKNVSVRPRVDKGKGRLTSEDQRDQDQDHADILNAKRTRVPAAPPSKPTAKDLEERKAQAIAKKKSQFSQAPRERGSSVVRQLPKVASPLKKVRSKRIPRISTGSDTDFDTIPRKKLSSRHATPPSSTVQGHATPWMDFRRVPSTTSETKPKIVLKLPQQENTSVAAPLLSPNALVQLDNFDKWILESERKNLGERRTCAGHNATGSEDGKGKGKVNGGGGEIVNDRPNPAPLFSDFAGYDEEVRRMYDLHGDGDGGLGGSGRHSPAPVLASGAPAPLFPVNSGTPPLPGQANGVQSPAQVRLQQRRQQQQHPPPPPPLPRSHSPQSLEPQIPKNRKDSSGRLDDSYRHGVVPETEVEESSNNNTQSQSQSQPESQSQPSKQGVGSSSIPESSLINNGAGGIAEAGGSGSRLQRTSTTDAQGLVEGVKGRNKLRVEATLPHVNINVKADPNARASGSRSEPVLQRSGTMTSKLVSRMKPRTPGSMKKLTVGVNGAGKGITPMLPLVLEDEHHLYLHHEGDFHNGSGLELVEDDGSVLHFPSSPLQEKFLASSPFATKTPTASNLDSVWKSSSPAVEVTSPTTQMTSTNKSLRPIPVLSPSKFTPHLPPTSSISNVEEGLRESDEREVEELVSSIEQFSSPESRIKRRARRRIGFPRNESENERSADDDDEAKAMPGAEIDDNDLAVGKEVNVAGDEFEASVHQRGMELAAQARRARLSIEEGRRYPVKQGITRDLSGDNSNETKLTKRKEWTRSTKSKGKEEESEKDKDNGPSQQEDEGWFSSALKPIPRWFLGNGSVTPERSAVQTTPQAQDVGEGDATVEEMQTSSAMAVDPKFVDLREEEEESTQDWLMEAQGGTEEVDVRALRDFVSQEEAGEEQGQTEEPGQEPEPPHGSEPMQVVEDIQATTQTSTADEPPEAEATRKSTPPRPSTPASKAASDLPTEREELDLVLPPTASTYQQTPQPNPESPSRDGPEHLGAAMALLNAKSLEISKLDAMLLAEQAKTQALSKEADALRAALVTSSSGPRPQQSALELELTEARQVLAQEKTSWETERNSMLASIDELKRGKQSAQADCDFFRDQYGQASAFVSSVRKENVELEAQVKRAEEQAKTGVEMIKATFVQRVQWLENDAQTWRRTTQHLIEMDKRTKGEELRRRAAEAPELRKKCDDLETKNEALSERIEDLEDEFDAKVHEEEVKRVREEHLQNVRAEDELMRQVELDNWRGETLRLNVELNEVKAELERARADANANVDARSGKAADVQASPHDEEMVYRCQWRPDGSICEGLFLSVEELQNHLFSGGHLHR